MGESLGIYSEVEHEAARDLVRGLIRLIKTWRLYEGDHPALGELQIKLRRKWDDATAGGPLPLRLTPNKVLLEDEPLYQAAGKGILPGRLYEHGIVGFVLESGIEPTETRRFVAALATEPGPSVDFASLLWEADLTHVQVLLDIDDRDEEAAATPEEFAAQVTELGDEQDPGHDGDDEYEAEKEELARSESGAALGPEDFDRFALTPSEEAEIEQMLESDRYESTVRQAARMVHSMAREALSPEDAATLERGIVALTDAVACSGDLGAAIEIAARARRMCLSDHDLELRVGELTLDTFLDPQQLWAFLRGLDRRDYIDRRALAEFFAQLGDGAAHTVGEWLLETAKPETAAAAMRVFGESGTEVLVGLYVGNGTLGRERIGPALLKLGTPRALLALAAEFAKLPQATRLKLLHLIGRNEDPGLRHAVLAALDDPAQPVRAAATDIVRRNDAPLLASLLDDFFERGVFESRYRKETEDFFEMLARVGDANVARVLAERCLPKRFRLGFGGMTPLQQLCVRALRRMRSPDAKPVIEELKRRGPKGVREILENPLGDVS
ncbi:MAG: hypothetical protein ACYTF8_06345 [Planctomycetota bacterium]|jgi:hypothetical protein